MNNTKTLLTALVFFILLSSASFAQTGGHISGEIKDIKKNSVSAASIALLLQKDSSIVKNAVTDKDGKFSLEKVPVGKYLVRASAIGYVQSLSEPVSVDENHLDVSLAPIVMKGETKTLNEVTVTAKKPMIEVKADKTVLNVAGSINSTGSTAMELLQKSPGVRVDKDDNISMNGKNGVRVYIDGKPSQMDGKDLAAYLKGMSSSDIEAIEIITNPSAKYDAAGNAGIINIRLNKNKNFGVNGNASLNTSFGITPKYNASTALNYRNKQVNVFGNYSYYTGEFHNQLRIYREQKSNGQLTTFDQQNEMIDHNYNHNFKVGADFFVTKKSTIGVMVNGSHISGPWDNISKTSIAAQNQKIDSILIASNRVAQNRDNFNYNLNYRYADTSGRELNVDADHGTFDSRSSSFQPNRYVSADGSSVYNEKIFRNNTPSNIQINSAKADYEQRLWGGKLGAGGKISQVKSDNNFLFYNVLNGENQLDPDHTNQFIYHENVNAAYVNFNKSVKKWSYQAGVRMEHTHAKGDLIAMKGESGEKVDTSYLNFFPSAGITYTVNKNNSLGITYSRRIDRPSYQDLNPFENKLDELTYEKGNPFIKPQYTGNFQVIHTFKQFLTTSLGYSHVKNFFTQVTDTADETKTFVTKRNITAQNIYSLNISAPLKINKWWNGYASLNAFHTQFKGQLNNGNLNVGGSSLSFYMQHSFTLSKTLSTEVSGFYNAPSIEGTIKSNSMWKMDLGIQKKVLKDQGSIKLSLNDVFNSMKWGGVVNFGGLYMKLDNKWESQQLKLAFNYRFGNKNVKNARERKTGLEDEQNRIKGGR
jgi:hypothetical protein